MEKILFVLFNFYSFSTSFQFTGVNEAGLEFGGANCSPEGGSIGEFRQDGHNLFRIPFAWEKMQPCIRCELDSGYLSTLKSAVDLVVNSGGIALIDCHNYFRYYEGLISDSDTDAFANLWWRLSQQFLGENIWFVFNFVLFDTETKFKTN
jgi:endoglucanase